MNQLKQIHANTLRNGTDFTKFLITKILEYPDFIYAHKLFDFTPHRTVFLYNKFIQAYSIHGPYHRCLSLYTQMCLQRCTPNEHSYTFLFAACASLSAPHQGKMLHSRFVKSGFVYDAFALTALIDMYAKLGLLELARQQFNEMRNKDVPTWNSLVAGYSRSGNMEVASELFAAMPARNVVSWTTMISGYSQNGKYRNALDLFLEMEKTKEVEPNEITIASVLPACANLGALEVGQRIEEYAKAKGYLKNMFVCNAILELHARCGSIKTAKRFFDKIGRKRNLCSWNTMIMGLAIHGKWNEALDHFYQMQREGTAPDDITFVGTLLACTHGGMVQKGREFFKCMEKKFYITPKLEHYGCMVDLLGRAGELQEAYNLIKGMPLKPDSVIWGTLLGACSFHGNVELAEKAAESLFELEPWNPGNYVILSNIYATAGRWDGVAELRKLMKSGQITKMAGHSLIEEGGQLHQFIVEDRSHPKSDEIYSVLGEVSTKMKLDITDDLDSMFEE